MLLKISDSKMFDYIWFFLWKQLCVIPQISFKIECYARVRAYMI